MFNCFSHCCVCMCVCVFCVRSPVFYTFDVVRTQMTRTQTLFFFLSLIHTGTFTRAHTHSGCTNLQKSVQSAFFKTYHKMDAWLQTSGASALYGAGGWAQSGENLEANQTWENTMLRRIFNRKWGHTLQRYRGESAKYFNRVRSGMGKARQHSIHRAIEAYMKEV